MKTRVVYLFGAGASHACVKRVGSPHGILMRDLTESIQYRLKQIVEDKFSDNESIVRLANSVGEHSDIEHIISFLDDIPSLQHREFANEIRKAFGHTLREKLEEIKRDAQGTPNDLYRVLLDIHKVEQFPEVLQGIITINYDEYIEEAIEHVHGPGVDFVIRVEQSSNEQNGPRLLKLHGSLGWQDTWPISRSVDSDATLWIAPGIHKDKQVYPFNVLWGAARELLACDVLRVVGCRLGPNDWDLLSLLFFMHHGGMAHRPHIEVIDSPKHAIALKEAYPYLRILSFLEIEPTGSVMINELTGKEAQPFEAFDTNEQEEILETVGRERNWFELWLTTMVEYHSTEIGELSTHPGIVKEFLET